MIAVFQCERSNVKIVGLQLFFVWREQFHEWVFLTNYTGTFFVNSLCMERTIVQHNCYAHKLFSRSAHTYCAHILLSRVTVGGDNHAAQRAYGSHQAGAFFFFLFLSDLCLPLAPVTHCCWVDLTVVTLADKDGFSKLVIDWFYKGDVGIKALILTEVWSTCGIIKSSYFVHSTVTVSFVTLRSFVD